MMPTSPVVFFIAASLAAARLPEPVLGELLRGKVARELAHGGKKSLVAAAWMNPEEVERSLIDVLSAASFGAKQVGADADVDLKAIEKSLEPLYKVLPKNKYGLLSHGTVRYALHRYFVRQNGLYIKGLDAQGEHWNASSPTRILQSKVPGFAQHLLDQRLPHGFDLREAAILAATLEHLVHTEELRMLRNVYAREGLDPEGSATVEQTTNALETYMVLLPGGTASGNSIADTKLLNNIAEQEIRDLKAWSGFRDLLALLHQAIRENRETAKGAEMKNMTFVEAMWEVRESAKGAQTKNMTFAEAARAVKSTWKAFSQWHGNQCKTLKQELLTFEDDSSGRVRLSKFYSHETPVEFEFTESMEYLRQLGALDESNPHTPRVIIPNYVSSATNCIVLTSMHWVCCIPDSEELMSHIEEKVGGPTATPEQIVEIVQQMPSDTAAAPRVLAGGLVDRLEEIAKPHHRRIPLHGRLFGQWMHHAFPRDFPYPFQVGETRPMSGGEWEKATGTSPHESNRGTVAGDLRWMEAQPEAQAAGGAVKIPWNQNEELLGYHSPPSRRSQAVEAGRSFAILMVLAVVVVHSNELFSLVTSFVRPRPPLVKSRKA